MLWPYSAPSSIRLPVVAGFEDSSEYPMEDVPILDIKCSKRGFLVAVITKHDLYIFRPKPLCPVLVYKRNRASIESHGDNETLFIHPDGFHLGLTTTKNNILLFRVVPQSAPVEVCTFGQSYSFSNESITESPGPGEAIGVREIKIRFRMHIKVDSGIGSVIPLDNYLVVITKSPPAVQLLKWRVDSNEQHEPHDVSHASTDARNGQRTFTTLLSDLDWLKNIATENNHIRDIVSSRAMSLMSITFDSGDVYSATLNESKVATNEPFFNGFLLHEGKNALISSINPRFSMVAVGCREGSVHLYNIKDYNGSSALTRVLDPPTSTCGPVLSLEWSQEGISLFVGYKFGWALYSTYGMLTASSFLSSKEHQERDPWLGGIYKSTWSCAGDHIFLVPGNDSRALWELSTMKWNMSGFLGDASLQKPVLYNDNKISIYRGNQLSDMTTIDRDALLWLNVSIPTSYIAENWPVRYVTSSTDGRYVALAGIKGLTHYSIYSGRWKLFVEDYMDREFSVRGGMVWYNHFLIVGAHSPETVTDEIRVYARDRELDSANMVTSITLPSSILRLHLSGTLLLVYTQRNFLYFYNIVGTREGLRLTLQDEVSLVGVIHSPARIRALSLSPYKSTSSAVGGASTMHTSLFFLADGILMLLEPVASQNGSTSETKSGTGIRYTKRIISNNLEYYTITQGERDLTNSLWGFDGKALLVWLNDVSTDSEPERIEVDTYPLAVLVDKGIATGIEADSVLPRDAIFTYFKSWTTTQLFVPYILEFYLQRDQIEDAMAVANKYRDLNYFSHILEMLLYKVLDSGFETREAEKNKFKDPEEAEPLLNKAVELVSQFPQMLEVILGCTRKTEVKYWPALFDVVGSPQVLFEKCLSQGKLNLAAGYVLVLHNLDQFEKSPDNTLRLLKLAYEAADWDLCKEMTRFLTAIDPSLETLKTNLQVIGIKPEN